MLLKLSLDAPMTLIIFIKILMNAIQTKNAKKLILLDDIVADMLSNKKHLPIVKELFTRVRNINISSVAFFLLFFFFFFFFLRNFSLLYEILLHLTLHTTSLWKSETSEMFNKLQPFIHLILILESLWGFTKIYRVTIFFHRKQYKLKIK